MIVSPQVCPLSFTLSLCFLSYLVILASLIIYGNNIFVDFVIQREEMIRSNISKAPQTGFKCDICHFSASSRHKVFCHLEAKHFKDSSVTYMCNYCDRSFSTRNSYGVHITTYHRNESANPIE